MMTVDFRLPGCQSLKEKRRRLKGLKDRFGKISNLAVSESGQHDNHQHSQWCFVAIGADANQLEQLLAGIETYASTQLDTVVCGCRREWL
jgi:uncharacterized protein YlxP (DUF503 family)